MTRLEDVHEIKSFLSFTTYLSKFLSKLLSTVEPLRKLIKKYTAWEWMKE